MIAIMHPDASIFAAAALCVEVELAAELDPVTPIPDMIALPIFPETVTLDRVSV